MCVCNMLWLRGLERGATKTTTTPAPGEGPMLYQGPSPSWRGGAPPSPYNLNFGF